MDKKELANIANAGPTAKGIFTVLSQRDREARNGVTDLSRVRHDLKQRGFPVLPEEFEKTFLKLEKVGVGKLIRNEEKKPMSFKWNRPMKEVTIAAISEDYTEAAPITKQAARHAAVPGEKELSVMLGPDRGAYITVPADLTSDEAEFVFKTLLSRARR
jgi:hypothetical protein